MFTPFHLLGRIGLAARLVILALSVLALSLAGLQVLGVGKPL